jgi:hypothetical protein
MAREHDDQVAYWAEKLFYPVSLKGKVPKKDPTTKKLGASTAKSFTSRARIRAQIARTTQRTPEVMVKITNRLGAGKGMSAIREHLSYISRNGKLELETDTGELISDKLSIMEYSHEWKAQVRGKTIPEVSKRREAFNIILSMPAGTPEKAVKDAARAFLEEEFGGKHRYCFTLHTDTDKPHVHACVLAAPLKKGKRLNPRKPDLQRWREGFAEQLRDIGIDANATPRRTRGVTQPPLKQAGHHVRKRQSMSFGQMDRNAARSKDYNGAIEIWKRLAIALRESPTESDKKTAESIEKFIANPARTSQRKR